MKNSTKAFTMIELMIVMAIIGILVTLSAFGLQQARESARDAQRKSDLQTIKLALEQYRTDCNNYPIYSGDFATNFSTFESEDVATDPDCPTTTITYIQNSPSDPTSGNSYYYSSALPGYTYIICAHLESGASSAEASCTTAGASCGGVCNYFITNP